MNFTFSTELRKDTPYIISVSGGVDSMVLLDYLYQKNYQITVVHFNHLKREESILDKELVQSFCKTRKIPFYYFELHLSNKDFQNQARLKRKEHLLEVANLNNISHIITAHHLDDLAETIFMKISRGSSLLGYSGMMPSYSIQGITYLKPLLYTLKDEITDYATHFNVPFLTDKTNNEDHYFRNRVRHNIIPELKKEGHFKNQIITYHKQLLTAYEYIRKEALLYLNNSYEISNLNRFMDIDTAVQMEVISYLLEQHHIDKSYDLISDILNGLKNTNKPNLKITLSENHSFIKSYNKAYIVSKESLDNDNTKAVLSVSNNFSNIPENSQEICYNILDYPLTVRRRQNGDVLHFKYGRKKLKDFLIDKKVPTLKRDSLWLVVDNNNQIIWIPNLYINQTLGNQNKVYITLREEQNA